MAATRAAVARDAVPAQHAARIALGRQVAGGIAGEEAHRLQREAGIFHRHHRKILGLADMGMAEGVPDHDVGVVDAAVLLDVARQAVVAGMHIGIVAAGVFLGRIIRRDPDMPGGKAAAAAHEAALLRQHQRARIDDQLVGRRSADRVRHVRVGDLPEPPGLAIGDTRRVALARQHPARGVEHIAVRIVASPGPRHEFMLAHGVAAAVDVHVQAGIEEVLVGRAAQIVVHHAAPTIGLAGHDGRGLDDAGQLGFELNGTVLVKVPVEAIVVIADGGEEADDEAPRTPHLEQPVAEFVVLPDDAIVLLVHADRVLHHERLALAVGGRHVEIVNVAEAVATELQRVGEHAEAVFAGVEGRLPEVIGGRIGIRHHHLGDAGAVDQ